MDDTDTCHKSLLRLDEMGDWQAVVKGAPTFADMAPLAVQKLATARDLLALQEANVATTLQRSDELLAQIVQGLAHLTARAKVLTLGSEHIQCRLDRSTGMELLRLRRTQWMRPRPGRRSCAMLGWAKSWMRHS